MSGSAGLGVTWSGITGMQGGNQVSAPTHPSRDSLIDVVRVNSLEQEGILRKSNAIRIMGTLGKIPFNSHYPQASSFQLSRVKGQRVNIVHAPTSLHPLEAVWRRRIQCEFLSRECSPLRLHSQDVVQRRFDLLIRTSSVHQFFVASYMLHARIR